MNISVQLGSVSAESNSTLWTIEMRHSAHCWIISALHTSVAAGLLEVAQRGFDSCCNQQSVGLMFFDQAELHSLCEPQTGGYFKCFLTCIHIPPYRQVIRDLWAAAEEEWIWMESVNCSHLFDREASFKGKSNKEWNTIHISSDVWFIPVKGHFNQTRLK